MLGPAPRKVLLLLEAIQIFVKRPTMDAEEKEETPCAVLPPPGPKFSIWTIFFGKRGPGGPRTFFAGTKIPVTGHASR